MLRDFLGHLDGILARQVSWSGQCVICSVKSSRKISKSASTSISVKLLIYDTVVAASVLF